MVYFFFQFLFLFKLIILLWLDERKVPIVLVQDELAKDQRALETLKNLNPIQLNVNNLPIGLN